MSEDTAKKIDEVNELRNKMIIESGHYARVEVVVGEDNMVVPKFEAKGATEKMVAMAILTLEDTAKELRKHRPIASAMTEMFTTDVTTYRKAEEVDE